VWRDSRDTDSVQSAGATGIAKIKQQEGPDLHVYGSANLLQTLIKHDLVDAFWLKIFPITLGGGKRLLADGTISAASLARYLGQVVPEPIFDITRLVEAAGHQRFDPILGGGSPERSDAGIPPGTELDVRRQSGVDEALGVSDRPFVKPGNTGCQLLNERV
jgi:hypothetical protein